MNLSNAGAIKARYVFSPWDPIRKKGDAAEDVAKTIDTRTKNRH
jgi:hypothetical protein